MPMDAPTGDSQPTGAGAPQSRPARFEPPSVAAQHERRSRAVLLLGVRMLFLVLLLTATFLPFVGTLTRQRPFTFSELFTVLAGTVLFGLVVIVIDSFFPTKRLASLFAVVFGIVVGLVCAWIVGLLIDLVSESWDLASTDSGKAYVSVVKVALGIAICYLAVSAVLTTKDDFRLVIPYVEFVKQVRGVRPMVLDSSVLIDGRVEALGETGFIDAPLVVPQFVIDELQSLADSSDKLKRERGRRGLAMVSKLQNSPFVDVSIDDTEVEGRGVDHMLLEFASKQNLRILTNDYNLSKVAQIRGVTALNINDLANTLKAQVVPGQPLTVQIIKPGELPTQGVGYLPDGTMVVVEDGAGHIGDNVTITVTNSLQTSAGRMIFGRIENSEEKPSSASNAESMAKAATSQPRITMRPPQRDDPNPGRNPRR